MDEEALLREAATNIDETVEDDVQVWHRHPFNHWNVCRLVSRGGVIGLLLLCMQLDEQEEKEFNREKVQGDMVCLLMNVLLGCFVVDDMYHDGGLRQRGLRGAAPPVQNVLKNGFDENIGTQHC